MLDVRAAPRAGLALPIQRDAEGSAARPGRATEPLDNGVIESLKLVPTLPMGGARERSAGTMTSRAVLPFPVLPGKDPEEIANRLKAEPDAYPSRQASPRSSTRKSSQAPS